ncbi:MAG: hypothetical protein P4L10_09720 [Acidobacteriaceae bacterium]|nr:hypothetical protein [Acidobacteriaceae bacterium]
MKSLDGLSVSLLGPDIDHKKSLEAMLAGGASKLTWLPDSASLQQTVPAGTRQSIQKILDRFTHTRDKAFLSGACRRLDDSNTEVIVAYWGTGPLSDIIALKRIRPHIKMVLMVLCFPLALNSLGLRRQNWLMRHAAPYLDGILYPNMAMRDYFRREVLGTKYKHLQELVLKPCWPQCYQPTTKPSHREIDRPNLIFVGRTDLSSRTIHIADDLRPLMAEILENGIELHHARSRETTDGHPYRRPFDSLDQAGLIAKMPMHDASLIAYNTAACQRKERIEFTVPDRVLTSVAAGIPIAIPSIGYSGCKEYLEDYPAVLEFDSVADLKLQLSDRGRIAALHEAAWRARRLYTAEAQGNILVQFLVNMRNAAVISSP